MNFHSKFMHFFLVVKSKAYYFVTYPELPKKPVLSDVMMKIAVVVGDQTVYTLLVEDIKNEHAQEYEKDLFMHDLCYLQAEVVLLTFWFLLELYS